MIEMRVLCFNPPFRVPVSWGVPPVNLPLGLAYVTAVVQKKNDAVFLDASAEGFEDVRKIGNYYYSGLSKEEIVERVREIAPDVICMSITFTFNSTNALDVLREIKRNFPNVLTVVGGAHVTVKPEEVLKDDSVDFVVVGEGEKTVDELLDCIAAKGDISKIKGIGYKENGRIVMNEARGLIMNLDELPFPVLELMPLDIYSRAEKRGRSSRPLYTYNDRWTSIITSRGCPMNCIFCSIHLSMGRLFRPRSPENVIAEIERDYKQFGIRHFNLEDDNMTLDKARFGRICDLIVERGLKITWAAPNGIRADRVDEELIRKMKASGCKRVFVAPESGSQRVLDEIIDKRMKLADVEKAVEMLSRNGIKVDMSFILGFPGETKEEMWETVAFAKKLKQKGAADAGFNIATPLYGTRLYDEVVRNGYFDPNTDPARLTPQEANITAPGWTKEELLEIRIIAIWSTGLSLYQKIAYPFRNPSKIPQYVGYFLKNMGKAFSS